MLLFNPDVDTDRDGENDFIEIAKQQLKEMEAKNKLIFRRENLLIKWKLISKNWKMRRKN